jgi:DNA mismatch repair protein MutL
MHIQALPQETCHLLGSTLSISTPTALVKELVENALDAKSTSVEILLAPNTVDKIEVRDNGEGILPADFSALGRRGHTSKLRSLEDLQTIGGRSLGFRGIALASVCAIANVSIVTRDASSPAASRLELHTYGGISHLEVTSAPVGTSVTAAKLFSKFPVREKAMLHSAAKTVNHVKELLQSYALARPSVRFAFRVIGQLRQSWTYMPHHGGSVREVVLQSFGADVASQCTLAAYWSPDGKGDTYRIDNGGDHIDVPPAHISFLAFLPSSACNVSKVIGKDAFICVDSRPLSTQHGDGKDMMTILQRTMKQRFGQEIRRPFLWMNVSCPPGSYDVNVEPSKSEVVFVEQQWLLRLFEGFCDNFYLRDPKGKPLGNMTERDDRAVRRNNRQPTVIDKSFDSSTVLSTHLPRRTGQGTSPARIPGNQPVAQPEKVCVAPACPMLHQLIS